MILYQLALINLSYNNKNFIRLYNFHSHYITICPMKLIKNSKCTPKNSIIEIAISRNYLTLARTWNVGLNFLYKKFGNNRTTFIVNLYIAQW